MGPGALGQPRRHQAGRERHLLGHQQHRGADGDRAQARATTSPTSRSAPTSSRTSSRPASATCRSSPASPRQRSNEVFLRERRTSWPIWCPSTRTSRHGPRDRRAARPPTGLVLQVLMNADLDEAVGFSREPRRGPRTPRGARNAAPEPGHRGPLALAAADGRAHRRRGGRRRGSASRGSTSSAARRTRRRGRAATST